MKLFFILLASVLAVRAQTNVVLTNWTFTNLQGRVYSNTTLRSASPTGIAVAWEPYSYAKVDFTNLPDEVRQMFHFDPVKAVDFEQAEAARKKDLEHAAQLQAEIARIKKAQRRDLMEVLQIVPDGVLANAIIGVSEELAQAAAAGRTKLDYSWRRDLVILWHYRGQTFDGAYIVLTNYQIGTYQYTTVGKTDKTVPRVTVDLGVALEYLNNPNSTNFDTDSELDALAEAKRLSRDVKPNKPSDSVKVVADLKPKGSGTGFFITDDGI